MQNKVCKYYEFAGVRFKLSAPEFKECEQIAKFHTELCDADVVYDVTFTDHIELLDSELLHSERSREYYETGNRRVRVIRHDTTKEIVMMDVAKSAKNHEVFFLEKYPKAWGETIIMKIMNLPEKIIFHWGIFLHASFVVWNGEAILFSGRKQIGKSTQAKLWQEEKNACIANGDRAILKKIDGKWYACGSPYCGTSKICENVNVPIRCIVILEQGKENVVHDVSVREAFISLMKNCSYEAWDKKQLEKVLSIIEEISTEVQFVKLSCLPDKSSVKILEEYLCQSQK